MSWAIWITGPPESGKTSIARAAATQLRQLGESVTLLELDAFRQRITPQPAYTDSERELVYRALVYTASQLVEARVPVILDAAAERRAWRDAARAAIPRFAEVQLHCPLEVRRERERIQAKGRPGAMDAGVDIPYEPALAPDLVIVTSVDDVPSAAAKVAALAGRLAGDVAESARAS